MCNPLRERAGDWKRTKSAAAEERVRHAAVTLHHDIWRARASLSTRSVWITAARDSRRGNCTSAWNVAAPAGGQQKETSTQSDHVIIRGRVWGATCANVPYVIMLCWRAPVVVHPLEAMNSLHLHWTTATMAKTSISVFWRIWRTSWSYWILAAGLGSILLSMRSGHHEASVFCS